MLTFPEKGNRKGLGYLNLTYLVSRSVTTGGHGCTTFANLIATAFDFSCLLSNFRLSVNKACQQRHLWAECGSSQLPSPKSAGENALIWGQLIKLTCVPLEDEWNDAQGLLGAISNGEILR